MQSNRASWVIGNWKMNPAPSVFNEFLAQLVEHFKPQQFTSSLQVGIAPPALYLQSVSSVPNVQLGAQDVSSFAATGAYTGEISAQLLSDFGVDFCLIGHSERREYFSEDASILSKKVENALQSGLNIVFCVGESLAQREAGQAEQVILQQLEGIAELVLAQQAIDQFCLAYEPVWAIGTGQNSTVEDAAAIHAAIRDYLVQIDQRLAKTPILYGGSVKAENAASFAASEHIDGALVGGASLDISEFSGIIDAFKQAKLL